MTTKPFRIRTVTAFVTLDTLDFNDGGDLEEKIGQCSTLLREVESRLVKNGYEVQTVRIATNPFGEWLVPSVSGGDSLTADDKAVIVARVQRLNGVLAQHDINFCSLGPSIYPEHTSSICPIIVSAFPGRLSCSAVIEPCDVTASLAAAKCVKLISSMDASVDWKSLIGDGSHLAGGLGNFRFCTTSCVRSGIPFFPAAKAPSKGLGNDNCIGFALGLENGAYARQLLKEAKSIVNVKRVFSDSWKADLLPIQEICFDYVNSTKEATCLKHRIEYLGIDTSLNPSLDQGGSVARAIESLEEVKGKFGRGALAAAAAITTSLQSIPDVLTTGYCGLMLPVLEDHRLAELGTLTGSRDRLDIQKLLCISSVCGVGVDTVPVPGDSSDENLSSLMLDVAALAGRWNKQLSCRVFPVPNQKAGDTTQFDSPYLCNSHIFSLD
ncbi:hypothetical protein HJC23_010480 [Cyclotella cryptica]|uniref:DUF711 family protein n=1 Tax=Cyclotella cryptica TaxID=29204 RepID=A0ABD3QBL5_9STRA|eukprot:CCRYP_007054-RA/>CCRYP_007054-RA protein AED:0.33 eAED:0.33 QI:0/-1/0/1/-1/1/1/0/437